MPTLLERTGHRAGILLKPGLLVVPVVFGNLLGEWLVDRLAPGPQSFVVVSGILYLVLTAIPFVPGVEIGLGLLVLLGRDVAPLVYASTVAALGASFLVGRLVPERSLVTFAGDLRLRRVCRLLARLEGLDGRDRLRLMLERAPSRLIPFLLRHRYMALMVVVNLPGNSVIGGGGGVAMLAGLSRIFSPAGFLASICLATAPLPLAWFVLGESVAN